MADTENLRKAVQYIKLAEKARFLTIRELALLLASQESAGVIEAIRNYDKSAAISKGNG